MNRIILIGRLTKDPELRYTPNGVAVASFTLAVNRPFTNQQGEKEADFINIIVWRKTAENCANYLKKRSQTAVEGRLQIRTYDKDGFKKWITEVIAEKVEFLERKKDGNTSSASQEEQEEPSLDDLPF
jgi:single-strand DNA-binding protein